jgi:hypothetical protein
VTGFDWSYHSGEDTAFLWIHVDDGLLTASSPSLMKTLQAELSSILDLRWDSELASIIVIWVWETPGGFHLDQPMLIDKLILTEPSSIKT